MSNRYLKDLVETLLSLKDREAMTEFLQALLTPKELSEIPHRIQIIKLLKAGLPQREVAERLGVGIATVTRGAKEINNNGFSVIK